MASQWPIFKGRCRLAILLIVPRKETMKSVAVGPLLYLVVRGLQRRKNAIDATQQA